MSASTELREGLVAKLAEAGVIRSDAVRRAFLAVPREDFVPGIAQRRGLEAVYADASLIVKERDGTPTSSSSQPWIMAEMLEALDVRTGHTILEIGLGTGYNAALLSRLAGGDGRVTSVDIDPDLVADAAAALSNGGHAVTTAVADGRAGYEGGPFDRIIVTASADQVSRQWFTQLKPDGVLVVPLRVSAMQIIAVLKRTDVGLSSTALIPGGFMPLRAGTAAPVDAQPSITVRRALPGTDPINIQAYGAGIATATDHARCAFAGYLLQGPTATAQAGPFPAWPALWELLLTTDTDRHVTVYGGRGAGTRFGLIEPAVGCCNVLHAHRDAGSRGWIVDTVESYGPNVGDDSATLLRVLTNFKKGITSLDQLGIEVVYGDAALSRPQWARHVAHCDGHRIFIGWRGSHIGAGPNFGTRADVPAY